MSIQRLSFAYPVFLNLRDRLVVVVGAGEVGRRKLAGLLQAGARVRLIDPLLDEKTCNERGLETLTRKFRSGDLTDSVLVFACSNAPDVNRRVIAAARRRKIFCLSASDPGTGDFVLPAVLRRGPLTLAVATGGGSPALAAQIRDRLGEQVPDSWGIAVEIIAAVRQKWLTDKVEDKYNQQVLRSFWEKDLVPAVETGDVRAIDRLLQETFGEAFSLAELNLQLPEGMP